MAILKGLPYDRGWLAAHVIASMRPCDDSAAPIMGSSVPCLASAIRPSLRGSRGAGPVARRPLRHQRRSGLPGTCLWLTAARKLCSTESMSLPSLYDRVHVSSPLLNELSLEQKWPPDLIHHLPWYVIPSTLLVMVPSGACRRCIPSARH